MFGDDFIIKKPKVCLIFGGKSNEYEVSLRSAYSVIKHMDNEKYDIYKIGINKEGRWFLFSGKDEEILEDKWQKNAKDGVCIDFSSGEFIVNNERIQFDTILPIMHGESGEDGKIQGVFECANMKYIGCNLHSSAVCMDKYLTKRIVQTLGVDVSKDVLFFKFDIENNEKIARCIDYLHFPIFIKPTGCGSSVGVCKANDENELKDGLKKAFEYCDTVICEEYIRGKEAEVAILENDGALAISCVGNLEYESDFYDYDTKYLSPKVSYKIPADIPNECSRIIRENAKKIFLSLGCKSLSRVDFFVCDGGGVVFNEINTLPGFTDISMFPMLFDKSGISFDTLCKIIISSSHM